MDSRRCSEVPAVAKALSMGRVGGVLFDVGALGMSAGAVSPRASNSWRAHQDPPAKAGGSLFVCDWCMNRIGARAFRLSYI